MDLYHFFILLSLACFCKAGPVVAVIVDVVGTVVGEGAAGAVAGSSMAGIFGVGASSVWYGSYVIIDGALYYGSGAAAVGVLGGAAAGGAYAKVTDARVSKSVMSSISAASVASVASVASKESASKASVASKASASEASIASKESASEALASKVSVALRVSLAESILGPGLSPHLSGATNKPTERVGITIPPTKGPAATGPAPTSSIPPPPASPASSLTPDSRPSEIPAGVPEYNFRMCQYDIIKMGQNNQNLTFDNPQGYSIRVDNIPSTCMVLATVMLGNPALGPHPVPMGAASLQWNNVNPDTINLIRKGFGLPPVS